MPGFCVRQTPLIVLGAADSMLADLTATLLIGEGAVVYRAHTPDGCLRVATSVAPDVILLDEAYSGLLRSRLAAHPVSRTAAMAVLGRDELDLDIVRGRGTLSPVGGRTASPGAAPRPDAVGSVRLAA